MIAYVEMKDGKNFSFFEVEEYYQEEHEGDTYFTFKYWLPYRCSKHIREEHFISFMCKEIQQITIRRKDI